MSRQIPALIVLIPFLAAIVIPVFGLARPDLPRRLTFIALVLMNGATVAGWREVVRSGAVRYSFGGWAAPLGIEWILDGLSAIVLFFVSGIGLVAFLFGGPIVRKELAGKEAFYHTLLLLLITALSGIVLAADLFNLFVFLEVSALCGYALVAARGGRALVASFRYLILGTIGASLYLLGVGYFYAATGTLNMTDLVSLLPALQDSTAALSGLIFIIVGLGIKMGLVPLHGWVPDAYSDASNAVSPLLASLMTKVALYAFLRIAFWVLGVKALTVEFPLLTLLGGLGAIASLVGGFMALSQTDLKRMLAYSGISHVGLVVMGISLGTPTGFAGGLFYLLTDAVMQAVLFFVAAAIVYETGERQIRRIPRLMGRSPWGSAALLVAAMSMIGIPPTGGFFGKWFLILAALEAENYAVVFVIVFVTLLTLAYFMKLIRVAFLEGGPTPEAPGRPLPWTMRLGMGLGTAAILLLGILSDPAMTFIRTHAIPGGF